MITDHAEGTFGCLRYCLGGDRPSQTGPLALSLHPIQGARLEFQLNKGGMSRLTPSKTGVSDFKVSHLSCTCAAETQCQVAVKVHGVFPSSCGYLVSSPEVQFRRVRGRDSAQVVTRFVQVGTYPTRNFATLGPL